MEVGEAIPKDHEDHDMEEPHKPVEKILEKYSNKRKPRWDRELIQEIERYGALEVMHRERERPKPYNNYVAMLCDTTNREPSPYEEAT